MSQEKKTLRIAKEIKYSKDEIGFLVVSIITFEPIYTAREVLESQKQEPHQKIVSELVGENPVKIFGPFKDEKEAINFTQNLKVKLNLGIIHLICLYEIKKGEGKAVLVKEM